MFARKKDQAPIKPVQSMNGRYVRVNQNQRGGYVEYGQAYPHVLNNNQRLPPRGIPETEISESYLTAPEEEEINKKKNKNNRRKIPFLQKKKKNQSSNNSLEQTETGTAEIGFAEDDDDITTYDEGLPINFEGLNISNSNPSTINQYKKTEQTENQYEVEAQIQERLKYIVGNYRPPPAYPSQATPENGSKSMIQQLLQEKNNIQMKDNASMINYCQVDVPKGLSMEDLSKILQSFPEEAQGRTNVNFEKPKDRPADLDLKNLSRSDSLKSASDDKLVMRTLNSPSSTSPRVGTSPVMGERPGNLTPSELYERRNMYYRDAFNNQLSPRQIIEPVPEVYPEPDYEADNKKPAPIKRQQSGKYIVEIVKKDPPPVVYTKPEVYTEHPEPDYDLPRTNATSYELNQLELYQENLLVESSLHLREKSETFVPPSPYMYTEIPEWLQVYSKASPDLDKFLKWEMFRIPELDCWQTMLKRLYMKELEQVVLWFEEYRQSLQHEIERRERELGITRVAMPFLEPRLKKTDV